MKRNYIFAALVAAASLSAQQTMFTKTLPAGYDTLDGNYTQTYPFGTANQSRWQFFYDWSTFYHQCPQTLLQIDFRRNAGALYNGAALGNVLITMSSLPTAHLSATTNFANNTGPDAVTVYNGPLTLTPWAGAVLAPGQPAPWTLNIPLQTPFEFDPTRRKDLCVDITVTGVPGSPGMAVDGVFPTTFGGRTGTTTGAPYSGPIGDTLNVDAVAIINLTYQLGAVNKFNMLAQTQGLGVGDLFLAATNVPAGTAYGYTLITAAMSPVFGKGPAFGIMPDPLTFSIFTLTPAFGDPLAWTYPAGGVAYPDVPLSLPPGAVSFLAGQTWDLVTVAFDPAYHVLGLTAPAQLAW